MYTYHGGHYCTITLEGWHYGLLYLPWKALLYTVHLPWKALLNTVHLPWKRSTIGEVEDLVGVQQLAEAGDQLQALHHNPDYAS
jgi:hypothetical protein